MGGWWAAHAAARSALGVALVACALYCLARIARRAHRRLVARPLPEDGRSDASHLVMDGAMAAVFLPVGNHVGGTTWTWVFGVLTACFGILTVTSLLAGRSAGDRRRDISASGYHILCAAAMVYMSAGMSPGMVAMPSGGMAVPGRPRGPTLAAPALGWILLCLAVLDAARHLARLAPRGAARASPGSLPLPTLVPSKGPAPPLLSPPRRSRATRRDVAASLLGSPRLAAAPHLTMDLSMVAMLSTMLPAR